METLNKFEKREEEFLNERIRNTKKLILIENLNNLGLSPKKTRDFIKFYYENIDDLNVMEALDEFKGRKLDIKN